MCFRIAALAAALSFGCTFHAGLDGIDAALFGSQYHHLERFTDAGPTAEGEDGNGGGELKSWSTSAGRTFGTVALEWKTDSAAEKGSMRGKGMSNNLQKTLGEGAIETLGDDAKCILMPALCADIPAVADFLNREVETP